MQEDRDVKASAPPNIRKPPDFSDAGTAEVFAEWARGHLLWSAALGWLVWDGKRWDANEAAATGLAMEFAWLMLQDAAQEYRDSIIPDEGSGKITIPEQTKRYTKHAQRARSAIAIRAFMELSRAWLSVKADDLDNEWHILNTEAGRIDLRTGDILPHDPAALCTKIAPYAPGDEGAALWADFLALITQGDKEYQRHLQTKAGAYAYGKILHEGVDFAIGGGRNGKSTFFNALSLIFGDYAGSIDSTVLTTERQQRGAALATLRGKRLVTCGELEEGQRLSVQTIKRIASTDPLTIEQKYKDPETVRPSHHIVLFSNFLPRVGSTDAGTWRRISVLPFKATMPAGREQIPNYAEALADHAGSAIMQWVIEGARMFFEEGYRFARSEAVIEATKTYAQNEDWLQNYLSERCTNEPAATIRSGVLYDDYKQYAMQGGEYCRRGADFARAMEGAGYQRVKINGRAYWRGLKLQQDSGWPFLGK